MWKEGVAAPLFTSPYTADRLTAGCWSPSRAAVLFLAKADGSVDVWDLADRTHEPSTSFNVVGGAALTSLDMFAQQSTQLLAAGDDQGTLHIMNIPRTLRRAPASERAAMCAHNAQCGPRQWRAVRSAAGWQLAVCATKAAPRGKGGGRGDEGTGSGLSGRQPCAADHALPSRARPASLPVHDVRHPPCRARRAAFIAREELRVAYVQRRAEEAEADAQHAGANPEAAAPDAAAIGALGGASDEASEEDEDGFDAQAEEEYRMLEIAFKAELGLLDADDEERQREGSDASPHAQNGDAA